MACSDTMHALRSARRPTSKGTQTMLCEHSGLREAAIEAASTECRRLKDGGAPTEEEGVGGAASSLGDLQALQALHPPRVSSGP